MAISVQIYSNANSSSKSISFEFLGNILAPADAPANVSGNSFYFQATAGATQDNNKAMPVKIMRGLDELVLNKQMQSFLNGYSTNAYADVRSMIIDYTYDYINGHTADEGGSGCAEQRPMKFK